MIMEELSDCFKIKHVCVGEGARMAPWTSKTPRCLLANMHLQREFTCYFSSVFAQSETERRSSRDAL